MKNKIRCLSDKITFEDLLGIFGICICALLIFTMVFAPISASAADVDSTMILKAGTYRFNDVVTFNSEYATALIDYTITSDDGEVGTLTAMSFMYLDNIGEIVYGGTGITDIFVYSSNSGWQGSAFGTSNESLQNVTIINDTVVKEDFATQFIANTNYNEVNGGSPSECPTLEEQISNYNGTWTDFLMLLRQNNRTLADSYQNNIDLATQSGYQSGANSVTLEQRLSEFDGDWQDFERLMAEYNVDLQTMYTYYVNSLETQSFEDGKDYGQEVGYKEGYNSGLNKGQSDTFTKNFFTDFLGGVVEAIDSIHLYEHIREIDGGVSTVVEWYISPWTIFTSMICLIVVIIILKVWLGG